MSELTTIEGDMTHRDGRYALVVGRWNSFVVEHLLEGAIDTLRRQAKRTFDHFTERVLAGGS